LGIAAGRIECKKKVAAADKLLLGVISIVHFWLEFPALLFDISIVKRLC